MTSFSSLKAFSHLSCRFPVHPPPPPPGWGARECTHELVKGHKNPNVHLKSKKMRSTQQYPVIIQGSRDLSWTNTFVSFMLHVCIRDRLHLFPKPQPSKIPLVVCGDAKADSDPMVRINQIMCWILFTHFLTLPSSATYFYVGSLHSEMGCGRENHWNSCLLPYWSWPKWVQYVPIFLLIDNTNAASGRNKPATLNFAPVSLLLTINVLEYVGVFIPSS